MKIAIDLTSFNKNFQGGKEKVVLNLITGFSELGHGKDIIIFCYDIYYEKVNTLIPNAKVITFKRAKCKKLLQDLYIRTFLLKKHLNDADILFFPIYYTGFYRFKIPTVVLPHDIKFKSIKESYRLLQRIKNTILYYSDFKKRDYIIAISKFDQDEMNRYYKKFSDKIKLIFQT